MTGFITALLPSLIVCYSLAFVIELRRQLAPGRLDRMWTLIPLSLGWVLHTIFLAFDALQAMPSGMILASWHHWWLMLAWGVGLASGLWIYGRPGTVAGLMAFLPLLALVVIAWQLPRDVVFPVRDTWRIWIVLHGIFLLLGTGTALVGSLAGFMYLWQSGLLRRKQSSVWGMRLPNLEWLQRLNERSLLLSSLLVLAGLLVGVLSNIHLNRSQAAGVPWNDPVVWSSGLLFIWLLAADIFSLFYKPARQGRKVAYLTVASFMFLGLVLALVLWGPTRHARAMSPARGALPAAEDSRMERR